MTSRTKIFTDAKWEKEYAYSRAIKAGNLIITSGTAAIKDGEVVGINSASEQTRVILNKIEEAIKQAGGSRNDIIRTRIYVTDISCCDEIGKVHGEFFQGISPVTTMVEVSALIDPGMIVEIEAEAIVDC